MNKLPIQNIRKYFRHCGIGFSRLLLSVPMSALILFVLISCGESDLKELQISEIENAQREAGESIITGEANESQNPEAAGPSDVEVLLADFSQIFADEFIGTAIDESRWSASYSWGSDRTINEEEQYYVDSMVNPDFGFDPFGFDGESLLISAVKTPEDLRSSANNQAYLSGVLTTLDKFSFTYGFVEVRAKLPAGKGLWPGVWMLGEELVDRKPQLFVMDNRGDNLTSVYHRYNYTDDNGNFQKSELFRSPGSDFSADFHTFGVHWEPGKLSFYVDGTEQHTIEGIGVADQAMYLILNLAVGGWLPESPDEATVFPAEYLIDYVRVYQKN